MLENLTTRSPNLRKDNSLEFVNREIDELTKSHGVKHEKIVLYTLKQNGTAEKENRTVVETARTLLHVRKLNIKL